MVRVNATELKFDDALKLFKRKVNKAGILYECRRHEYFMNKREMRIFKQKNKMKKK